MFDTSSARELTGVMERDTTMSTQADLAASLFWAIRPYSLETESGGEVREAAADKNIVEMKATMIKGGEEPHFRGFSVLAYDFVDFRQCGGSRRINTYVSVIPQPEFIGADDGPSETAEARAPFFAKFVFDIDVIDKVDSA